MKLLICTQKVDADDAVLGFFHRWIEKFAEQCAQVTVICLEEGRHDLPSNVAVYSLGKEKCVVSRITYALRFRKLIKTHTDKYDVVFVHMNPEYIVLGGLFWRRQKKKISLWYVHKSVTVGLRVALFFADAVFTAARESFLLKSPKVHVVGHGIDVERYTYEFSPIRIVPKIVSVGRITPIKHLEIIVKAQKILKDMGVQTHLTFVGVPAVADDKRYENQLRTLVHAFGLDDSVVFKGSIPHGQMPDEYKKYDISINMAPTGGIDKAILESMAAGIMVIAANKAFAHYFGTYTDILLCEASPEKLADRIKMFFNLDKEKISEVRRSLRESAEKNASLDHVTHTIVHNLYSTI